MPEDFRRSSDRVNFSNVSDPCVEIHILFREDFESVWSKNPDNPIPFQQVLDLLSRPGLTCWFQKQPDSERNKSRHKIFVSIDYESAVELRVSVSYPHSNADYYYYVQKCRIIPSFHAPKQDTYTATCSFHIMKPGERGSIDHPFIKLLQTVNALEICKTDLNRDKDRQIWKNYVVALKKIVRGKERIWKIKKIFKPYRETVNNAERATFVDICISEEALEKQFERVILDYFGAGKLEKYEVAENHAFVELNGFRELPRSEKDKLSEMICECFYEISPKSPTHSLSGEIDFKYSDKDARYKVFSNIMAVMEYDYRININITGDGRLETKAYNLIHVKKVINDRFSSIVELKKDNSSRLKVTFPNTSDDGVDLEVRRDFKTATDFPKESNYDISSSILTIWADDEDKYNSILDRVKSSYPDAVIEEAGYQPSYIVEFKANQISLRKSVVLKIQDELRGENINLNDFDSSPDYSRNRFRYNYEPYERSERNERCNFIQTLKRVCSAYEDLVTFSFDSHVGNTVYEFVKNEKLERDNEIKIDQGVRKAPFLYLSPKEMEKLKAAKDDGGDDYSFAGGTMIGTLVVKSGNRLKFRITDDFNDMLNDGKETLPYLESGYITPVFNGELVNIRRMMRAMSKVTDPGVKSGYPVNRNLPDFLFDPTTARIPAEGIEEEKIRIQKNLNEPLLKDQPKQLEAVAKAMLAKDIAIIQGPPGTGKTTVIAEIIWQTLLENPDSKILITSQTNLAVDNALERLKGKKLMRPIRIGSIEKFEDEGKVYSDKRLYEWRNAAHNSKEEKESSDNAIAHWIADIGTRCDESAEYSGIVSKWKEGLSRHSDIIKSRFSDVYLKHVNVFAATCSECGSSNFTKAFQTMIRKDGEDKGETEFDLVIMDEASKATPPELVLPLTLGRKVVVIGDHKQLPPMIDENDFSEALEAVGAKKLVEDWTREDYKVSQFEKLFVNSPRDIIASLDTQFRMHKQIMNCISQFYKDQKELEQGLICGIESEMDDPHFENGASRWHGLSLPPFITQDIHAIWVDVSTPEQKVGTSYKNDGEIDAIKEVLRVLCKASGFVEYNESFQREVDREIGIITYYMPQMQKIRDAIYPQFTRREWRDFDQHKYENGYHLPFRINTVDRFQGMERNIVIVSTVRSDWQIDDSGKRCRNDRYPQALGFARELPRINVGFSRAKRLLIVIGNKKHFSTKPEYAEAIGNMYKIDISQLKNL
jgi:hypothetical protein